MSLRAIVVSGVVLGAAAGAQTAQAALPETLMLDSNGTVQNGASGPVATTDALAAGEYYVAEVTGTYSAFNATLWTTRQVCGTAEPAAMFPSPSMPPSMVGTDAEMTFARPRKAGTFCPALPRVHDLLEIADQGTFAHRAPIGGTPTTPSAGHTYSYLLASNGTQAQFRLLDTNVLDNSGQLSIVVRDATVADCGGDPGCVSAVTTGPPPVTPPPPAPAPPPLAAVAPPPRPTTGATGITCRSRRAFRINLRLFRKDPVVSATIRKRTKNGPKLKVTKRGRRLGATVDLTGEPGGKIKLYIVAHTRSGKVKRGTRSYELCATRRNPPKPYVL